MTCVGYIILPFEGRSEAYGYDSKRMALLAVNEADFSAKNWYDKLGLEVMRVDFPEKCGTLVIMKKEREACYAN